MLVQAGKKTWRFRVMLSRLGRAPQVSCQINFSPIIQMNVNKWQSWLISRFPNYSIFKRWMCSARLLSHRNLFQNAGCYLIWEISDCSRSRNSLSLGSLAGCHFRPCTLIYIKLKQIPPLSNFRSLHAKHDNYTSMDIMSEESLLRKNKKPFVLCIAPYNNKNINVLRAIF